MEVDQASIACLPEVDEVREDLLLLEMEELCEGTCLPVVEKGLHEGLLQPLPAEAVPRAVAVVVGGHAGLLQPEAGEPVRPEPEGEACDSPPKPSLACWRDRLHLHQWPVRQLILHAGHRPGHL